MEIPGHISLGGPGVSPGFLGMELAPFRVTAGPNPIPNLRSPLGDERLGKRASVLEAIETGFAKQGRGPLPKDHQTIYDKSFRLMSSQALDAFKIEKEDAATRERYGASQFGRDCLLARRLVEIGVPFVEVGFGGWDMHTGIFAALAGGGARGMNRGPSMLAQLDQGFSALIQDLIDRGLYDTTTVVWMGDFGRTPRINQNGGRDHWARCWSVVLGGGAIKGGQVYGSTNEDGTSVKDEPCQVGDVFATVYQALGISPDTEIRDPLGRPRKITGEKGGSPLKGLS
jgi:hypothetical protein